MAHSSWKTMHWRRSDYLGESSVQMAFTQLACMSERRLVGAGSDDVQYRRWQRPVWIDVGRESRWRWIWRKSTRRLLVVVGWACCESSPVWVQSGIAC